MNPLDGQGVVTREIVHTRSAYRLGVGTVVFDIPQLERPEVIDPFKKVTDFQTRAQASTSCRLDLNDNEYIDWIRAMMNTSADPVKLAQHRLNVTVRVTEMGNAGYIDNMQQREAAIIAGMLPYVDPITMCDGVADHDAVKLRGRCVSRRSMVQYLELNANVRHRLRLPTGDPIEVEDMQLLYLNPEEYAFFNEEIDVESDEHEDRDDTQLELYDILAGNDDYDDNDGDGDGGDDMEHYRAPPNDDDDRQHDYDVIVTLMRSKRKEAMREHCEALLPSLIDPTITCEEFGEIVSRKVEMPFTLSLSEWEAFGFREVPVDEEFGDWNTGSPIAGFSNEAYLDLNEVTSNCGKLLAQIIAAYYDDSVERTEESHDDFLDKIDYVLSDWGSSGFASSYKLYKYDLYAAVLFALKGADGMLLRRLFQWSEVKHSSTTHDRLEYDNNIAVLRTRIHEAMDEYSEYAEAVAAEPDDDSDQPIDYDTVRVWVNKMVFDISEEDDW